MRVEAHQLGKRYNRNWIFHGVSHTFTPENPTVILGGNGSGKSTLLKVLSGYVRASAGTLSYQYGDQQWGPESVFSQVAYCAPYLELYEELLLEELIDFHFQLKPLRSGIRAEEVPALIDLEAERKKTVRAFSSGMKQRVKIGLAVLSDCPLLLLDEPCSNLDQRGRQWYADLVAQHTEARTVLVCSNHQPEEYPFCREQLEIENYKPRA